jgi:hypothetical protein
MRLPSRCLLVGNLILAAVFGAATGLPAANLVHRYSFTADAGDSVGAANGDLLGGAAISGGAVVLNGSGAYVDLPNGIVSASSNVTFEAWLTDNGSGNWARLIDFGCSTGGEGAAGTGTNYLYLCPQSGGGILRGGITTNLNSNELNVDSASRLPAGSLTHVVWTIDAATQDSRLYVDSALVGENTALKLNPAMLGDTFNNWLGRSQFSGNPYLKASLTEFRIYDSALTQAEVYQNYTFGPDSYPLDGPVSIFTQPQGQTVTELAPVAFSVVYQGEPPVDVQWRRNGSPIAGATNGVYALAAAALTNNGAVFSVVLTNSYTNTTFSVSSSNAVLNVIADTNPPVLVRAAGLFLNGVAVTFSEGVRADAATNAGNYLITSASGPLAVSAAQFDGSTSNILLTTATQIAGTNYTLTVNGVRDLAAAANLIATNSQAAFVAMAFSGVDIGNPAAGGTLAMAANGFDLTASSGGVSRTNDQFTFGYRNYTNDFDVQVRVAALAFAGAWTRAGLMARDGLTTNAPFAASLATPGPAGCYFASRAAVGGSAAMAGYFPVNYPDTWLRLRRTGNVFDGFASLDGRSWEFLGSTTLAMSATVQVGFALAAGGAAGGTAAQFRDFTGGTGAITTNAPLPFEPPGPSSRRTALVISEIMFHPPDAWGGSDLEFVELWNSGLVTEDLTGHKLAGDISYSFPNNTAIAPGQFLVVAKNPTSAQSFYSVSCLGPYSNKLPNGSGTVRLLNELGGILLETGYDTKSPWPVAPDGTGHSLVLSRPSHGENDPRAWSASDAIGGSPGTFEHYGGEPARDVVINEFLAHTDLPQEDYIELFNTGSQPVDLSGAWLSDDAQTNKFRVPDGTTISPRGFSCFTQTQLGFALAADGEQIFLVNSNRTRVLDAVAFDGQENGVSTGRYPDGAPGFQRLASVTQGLGNAAPLISPLVINEIMYHPISGSDDDEYVEIYNRGTNAVSLARWRLQDGINFTFPTNAMIAAGGYIVAAKDPTNLFAKYPQLNGANTFGHFSGSLKNGGERVALAMPDDLVAAGVTNIFYIVVDEVTYRDGGRWGNWSDGGGSSLELTDPHSDNRLAANWADSDESAKAAWTTFDVTNVLENGQSPATVNEGSTGYGVANRFEFFLQGPGEALADNLEFRNNGGTNLVAGGDFESGTTGWTSGGVLRNSYAQSGAGIGGSQALHLVASDRGDTGPNKIFRALTAAVITNAPNTGNIRAAMRWLKGSPYVLFRIRGNWMEISGQLNVPVNCGTPGLPNSRSLTNAGPAIVDVAPSAVLPAAGQDVVIGARPVDPDGVSAVTLSYRVDPAASYTSLAMLDNGTGGDAVAGDGIYSATIPGQAAGTLAAFYVAATDAAVSPATARFPAEAPVRECHARWGEPVIAGSIGTYRLWLTASNIAFWTGRERNANDPIDATFVYGNSRVIYSVDTMYSGSPFHAPAYNGPLAAIASDYEVNFHPGELFLGSGPFVLTAYDVVDGNFFFNDDSAQVDLTGTWIGRKLGQQYNYRRHIHVVMNGVHRGTIYDDAQQPNSEMLDEYHPNDSERQLRKIESWFEFADNGQSQGSTYATLKRVNKSTGEIDAKRYRWNWRPRATENPDDWPDFTSLVAAVNDTGSPNYEAQVRTWMDVPNFLRPIAVHHVCGSWDSYDYQRGKNMFAYKPDGQPWRLLMWDIEIALGAGGNGVTDNIYNMFDTTLLNMITSRPAFNREYLAAIQEAVDTALAPGAANAILDERYASFQQNNVPLVSPQFIETWIAQRRAYLLTVLPAAAFAVSNAASLTVNGTNTITLTGTAPLNVEKILINGNSYPVVWTSVTNWSVLVPLTGGTNTLSLSVQDRSGNTLTNATGSVTVNYTGNTVSPEGFVVFNEIMYHPAAAGAEFVELFNTHSNYAFDLSGWSVNGLGYTFPPGSTLPPRGYLVLAADPFIYSQTYGPAGVAYDIFDGTLDRDGETLTLFRPETASTNQVVVDRVRYEIAAPWPVITNAASLQLLDAARDNSRVANWTAVATNAPVLPPPPPPPPLALLAYTNVWRFMQVSNLDTVGWKATNYNDSSWPSGPGLLAFENNAALTNLIHTPLNDPRTATNGMGAGHADYFRLTLKLTNNLNGYLITVSAYVDDGAVFHVNGSEVARIRLNAGTVTNATLANAQPPGSDATSPDTFTLPASAFAVGTNVIAVEVHQVGATSSDIVFGFKLDATYTATEPPSTNHSFATPGAANSVAAALAEFPPVWLNELQADNVTGPLDNNSQRDPWVELCNNSTNLFSLAGYYLTDTYTNLTKWAFPTNALVASNGFGLVWCDNQTNQNATNSLHAAFALASGSGRVALTRVVSNAVQIVDYLNYQNLPANWSYGGVPDGQPFYRGKMFYATPGGTNSGAAAPISIFINEWMADNKHTIGNPLNGVLDDWFELYNPGTNAVDLGGYYLTDTLADKTQFLIPDNGHYLVPAGGYCVVWADNNDSQNSTNRPELHVNFALGKSGEAIGLFASDGTSIDAVNFGAQTSDVSQGRFPDGAANLHSMPAPTPEAANVIPNTAPVLAALTNRVVTLGQTLSFTASATDTDQPPQMLTFTLTNAPAGAQIGAASGLFAWTPAAAPATNNIGVVVTDNGAPHMSAAQTFSVVVAPLPAPAGGRVNGNEFIFDWSTFAGQQFQVEFKDDLNQAGWVPLGDPLTGAGGVLRFTNVLDESTQGYFRLRVLP